LNLTGDVHSTNSCATTLSNVNANFGSFGTANQVATFTVNAKGLITAAGTVPIALPFTSMTGTLGCAQMPAITGDVTSGGGTCNLVIGNNTVGDAKLAQTGAATLKGNPTNATANVSAFTIQGLANKPLPDVNNDKLLLFDAAAGGLKYCTVGQCSVSGTAGVSSLNLLTGALNISAGSGITVTPSGSNIQVGLTPVTNPTTTLFNAPGSGTYTTPVGVVRLEVTLVGGGGGGQGGGTTPGGGTAGAASTFGSVSAGGGAPGGSGGAGGSFSGACTVASNGGFGDGGSLSLSGSFNGKGGQGGGSFYGGGGGGTYNSIGFAGNAYGSGGGGGSAGSGATALGGTGGGSGGYCFQNIRTGIAPSYSYTVGDRGVGGAAGGGGGTVAGNGQIGLIWIKEYYSSAGGGGGGGGGGVTTLNTLLGDLTIAAGSGISISQAGSTITVTNSSAAGAIFTTGDIKPTMKTVADTGWVMMNDGTIGDATSGGTTRANADTQALFVLLWGNCTPCVVSGGRGSTALNDFNAHKTLALPQSMSRNVGVAGAGSGLSNRVLGNAIGSEISPSVPGSVSVSGTHTLTTAEMPQHNHTISNASDPPWQMLSWDAAATSGVHNSDIFAGTTYGVTSSVGLTSSFQGSSAAFTMTSTGSSATDIQMFEPKVYWNFMIKL
jgi:hypothetical protein